jgi:hypothetical protein
LAKKPGDRPQSAGDVAERLGLAQAGDGRKAEVGRIPEPASDGPVTLVGEEPGKSESDGLRAKDERRAPRRSKNTFYTLVSAVILLLFGLGYYLGVYKPEQKQQAEARAEREALGWVSALPLTASDSDVAAIGGKIDLYAQSAPAGRVSEVRVALEKQRGLILAERERVRLANARGGLIITTAPPGADVAVGGIALEKSPATLKDVRLGKYPVIVRLAGYEEKRLDAEVKENEFAALDVVLVRSTGSAQIGSRPPGLDVEVRSLTSEVGTQAVKTPAVLEKLPTGDYELTFHRVGWPDQKQTLSVQRNQTASALAEFIGGGLEINSTPLGAEVWMQGKSLGKTPLKLGDLVPASVDLEFRLKGYKNATAHGEVKAKETATFSATLQKIFGPQPGQQWESTLGMKFVPVPGTDVLFSVWDTRVQDFEAFVKATNYDATTGMFSLRADGWKPRGDTWKSPGFAQGPTHPVCGVSWDDAKAFCGWLTKKERDEGRLNPNQEYRLPTDAEWSVAVGLAEGRTGTPDQKSGKIAGVYPWGMQWPPPPGAGNYAGVEARDANWAPDLGIIDGYNDGYSRTSPVGIFTANKYGLYDMGGNVWQWCEDTWNVGDNDHVLRGASCVISDASNLLSSSRIKIPANGRCDNFGFRCVVTLVPP